MSTLSSVPEGKSIDKIIKTKYELALASEPTEDGKKAIERFYSLFLNNWPGFDHLINQQIKSVLDELEDEAEAFERTSKERDGLTHFAVPLSTIQKIRSRYE